MLTKFNMTKKKEGPSDDRPHNLDDESGPITQPSQGMMEIQVSIDEHGNPVILRGRQINGQWAENPEKIRGLEAEKIVNLSRQLIKAMEAVNQHRTGIGVILIKQDEKGRISVIGNTPTRKFDLH